MLLLALLLLFACIILSASVGVLVTYRSLKRLDHSGRGLRGRQYRRNCGFSPWWRKARRNIGQRNPNRESAKRNLENEAQILTSFLLDTPQLMFQVINKIRQFIDRLSNSIQLCIGISRVNGALCKSLYT